MMRKIPLRLVPLVAILALLANSGATHAVQAIRISADTVYFNVAASQDLTGTYVGFAVTNDDGGLDGVDVWVALENLAGGTWTLGAGENGLYHLGTIPMGETRYAYLYTEWCRYAAPGSCLDPVGESLSADLALYDGRPGEGNDCSVQLDCLSRQGFTWTADSLVFSSAHHIINLTYQPQRPYVGGLLVMSHEGTSSAIGGSGLLAFSPAGRPDWPADTFELVGTRVEFYTDATQTVPATSIFFDPDLTVPVDNTTSPLVNQLFAYDDLSGDPYYAATYTFRVTEVRAATELTPVSPVSYIATPPAVRHPDRSGLDVLPPIPPPVNTASLTKTGSPSTLSDVRDELCAANGSSAPCDELRTATYTVTLTNALTGLCGDSCANAANGACEDGGAGSIVPATCVLGEDCQDCGPRPFAPGLLILDAVRDLLPAGASYVPGSASYDDGVVVETGFPVSQTGADLIFSKQFYVPEADGLTIADGTGELTYSLRLPPLGGTHVNEAWASVGETAIDTTPGTVTTGTPDIPATATTTLLHCGDEVLDTPQELCDEGHSLCVGGPAGGEVCGDDDDCPAGSCVCSDPDGVCNRDDTPDACRRYCQFAACGDGVTDPANGETCDDGGRCFGGAADGSPCTTGRPWECPGGACVSDDGDGCRDNCKIPGCGDGVQEPGETCDDGNLVDGDGCDSNCGNPDIDDDGLTDDVDPDDDNDGVSDAADSSPWVPWICEDADGDGCDDCAVGQDGFGSLADNNPANDGPDGDGDGFCDAGDCRPNDSGQWSIPGTIDDLAIMGSGTSVLTWSAPTIFGGASPRYDVLRSAGPSDFSTATCVETDDASDTTASDGAPPSPYWYYLVRVENDCGGAVGAAGGGQPRTAVSCP